MKVSCDVIRDILPLYVEDMASNDSRKLVDEHLVSCKDCRDLLDEMETVEKLPIDAEIAPLQSIQSKLRRKRLLTIIFSVMITAVLATVIISYLTSPAYLPYHDDFVTVTEKDDGTIVLEFGEEVSGIDFDAYPANTGTGYEYHIAAWETIWNKHISKNQMMNTVLNPNGEKINSIYYYEPDGIEDILIYGTDQTNGGFVVTLPRLVLSYYTLFAAFIAFICLLVLIVFRNNKGIVSISGNISLLPVSYIIATFFVMGIDVSTYYASRDFYAILMVTIPLYFAMVLGVNLLRNYKMK